MTKSIASKKELTAAIYTMLQKYGISLAGARAATPDTMELMAANMATGLVDIYSDERIEKVGQSITAIAAQAGEWNWMTGGPTMRETLDSIRALLHDAENNLRVVEGSSEIDENDALKETAGMMTNMLMGSEKLAPHPLAGLKTLSFMSCGLSSGYYIFAGEPNVGKSAIMQNIMMDALNRDGTVCAYFSFDDSTRTTLQRLVSRETWELCGSGGYGFENTTKIYNVGNPAEGERHNVLKRAWDKIAGLQESDRLFLYDRKQVRTMDEVEYQIGKLKRKHGDNLIVCLDAVRKIKMDGGRMSTNELDDARSDAIDFMAIRFDIPLLTTHEMRKRPSEDRGEAPTIDDLKGSGGYGFNVKFGAFIYPVSRPDWKAGNSDSVVLYVDKNKLMEKTGKIYMSFDRAYNHLREVDE